MDTGILTYEVHVTEKEAAVPSFRRRVSSIGTHGADDPPQQPCVVDADQAWALAAEAAAEAAEAEAAAAAARARTRALQLRKRAAAFDGAVTNSDVARRAKTLSHNGAATTDVAATADTETARSISKEPQIEADAVVGDAATSEENDAVEAPEKKPSRSPSRWRIRGMLKIAAVTLAISCTFALLAASGYMLWQQRLAVKHQQESADYAAAARRHVVTLMSLDFSKVKEDVQHIIDSTTGKFRDDFKAQANDFIKVAQDSKVVADVDVHVAAVESMTDDSAVVLVSAISHVTNSSGAKQEPRSWRLSVSLQREGGQIKMSKVEFVP